MPLHPFSHMPYHDGHYATLQQLLAVVQSHWNLIVSYIACMHMLGY